MLALKRQFITDATGQPVAVILPIEEFRLVAEVLAQRLATASIDAQLQLLQQAPTDHQFLADLTESMEAFAVTDQEWWEPPA